MSTYLRNGDVFCVRCVRCGRLTHLRNAVLICGVQKIHRTGNWAPDTEVLSLASRKTARRARRARQNYVPDKGGAEAT